ncbi:hypothetical protein [Tistrella mobilis]
MGCGHGDEFPVGRIEIAQRRIVGLAKWEKFVRAMLAKKRLKATA